MKRLIFVAAALVALAGAGIAVAHGVDEGTQSITSVSGTFTATTISKTSTHSCTSTTGKTISSTNATYTGTATGPSDLTGTATLTARSTIDSTDNIGVVNGTLKVGSANAQYSAVYDDGTIVGTATGHGMSHAQLLANISATFSTTGGFTNGKIGGGTASGSAVELASGHCAKPAPKQPPETTQAEGAVTAVSSTSISVAGVTCAVPASLAAKVATVLAGDRVEIRCTVVNGTSTLTSIDVGKGKH